MLKKAFLNQALLVETLLDPQQLLAAILLFIPRLSWLGAILALGSMAGAIFFHLTKLGIEVMEDGGLLFILACVVFTCSAIILWIQRSKIPVINKVMG